MVLICMFAGAVLGALSRLEETTPGFYLGISTSTAWLGAAFLAGLGAVRLRDSAGLGAVVLTFANLGYYGWVVVTAPSEVMRLAGAIDRWFLLGVAGGIVFGCLGGAWRTARTPWRHAVAAVPLGVLVFEVIGLQTSVLGPAIP